MLGSEKDVERRRRPPAAPNGVGRGWRTGEEQGGK